MSKESEKKEDYTIAKMVDKSADNPSGVVVIAQVQRHSLFSDD